MSEEMPVRSTRVPGETFHESSDIDETIGVIRLKSCPNCTGRLGVVITRSLSCSYDVDPATGATSLIADSPNEDASATLVCPKCTLRLPLGVRAVEATS